VIAYTTAQREDLIRRYEGGPSLIRAAFDRVPPEARGWRPAEGRWSAHEIVCHAADSETTAAVRIRFLLAEPEPTVVGYDQDAWAKAFDYHSAPLEPAFRTIEAVRAHTAALLRRLPEAAWSIVGRHTQSGPYGTEDWLRIYAEHLEKHSRQIDRNVEAWKGRSIED
jgi:DinB superfamily